MTNYFLLSNEELIDRLVEVTEDHSDVNHRRYQSANYEHPDYMDYEVRSSREFWDIRKELLERLNRK